MLTAGEFHGRHVPRYINRQENINEGHTNIHESIEIEKKQTKSKICLGSGWMTSCCGLICAVITVCILAIVSIILPLGYSLILNKDVTTIASTSATATTTTTNPCVSDNLRWNTTGITVLSTVAMRRLTDIYIDENDTLYLAAEVTDQVVWKLTKNSATPTIVAGQLFIHGVNSTLLDNPQGVLLDSNGFIYVTDYNGHRLQRFDGISLNGVTVAGIAGLSGPAINQLNGPRYMTMDATETYIYIADSANHRVMRFPRTSTSGSNGVIVAGGNGSGNGNNQLNNPFGIYMNSAISNDLYIVNANGHSVMRWTPGAPSGTFIAGTPGSPGSSSTQLLVPRGIRVDSYSNVYVADMYNHRIQMFCQQSSVGVTIAGLVGIAGNGATELNRPQGIAFDSAMNLYVNDALNNRVQKFLKL